jgi:hypothetical protein
MDIQLIVNFSDICLVPEKSVIIERISFTFAAYLECYERRKELKFSGRNY